MTIHPRNPNQKQRTPCAVSFVFGGDKRVRTAGLLNAIQALYQLSYTPVFGKLLYCNIYAVNCQTFFAFMPIKIYCFRLSAFKRRSLLQAILRECVLHVCFVGTRFGNYFTSSPLSAFCNMIQYPSSSPSLARKSQSSSASLGGLIPSTPGTP